MNRWVAILTTVAMGAGALLLLPAVSGAPSHERTDSAAAPAASTEVMPPSPGDSVHVDHEFVVVHPAAPPPPVRAPRPQPVVSVSQSARSSVEPRTQPGLAARAGRMIVGDGRHRPEPFPRPDAEK